MERIQISRGLIPFIVVSIVTLYLVPFGRLTFDIEVFEGSYYWLFSMSWSAIRSWGYGPPQIWIDPFSQHILFHPLGLGILLAWILQALFFVAIVRNIEGKTDDMTILALGLLSLIPIPVSGFVFYSGNAEAIPIPIYLLVGLILVLIHRRVYGKLDDSPVHEESKDVELEFSN